MRKKKKDVPVEKKPEIKERVYTEQEKQFIRDNNMDEYIRLFGKPE